jgi:hypothetical protein
MANEKIKIELTVQQLDNVLAGLCELPAKYSFELINEIRKQADVELQRLKQLAE